ncbi:multiple sugar transport system substrate-binding protein [Caldanaerobius fijiensis DSM 17918]|uniref:Multiple sugar transport system substrate-binding protein n=1 Tax=Caldanaerobius fijiensis DSM 17918 TaxID=1121256 RepID=A0A1M5EG95_9THEO|nr:sugar ABC transporter substrate-binding protein [Caldanaerobius fijiensis]SHF78190.1 multiple sugar transport system substrate-binding protein [Caldanaerobius fijiensis DSM 17918]
MKKLISVALVSMMVLSVILAGCSSGSKTSSSNTSNGGGSNKVVTITHYTINAPDKIFIKKLIPDFEKTHPNIKVNVVAVPWDQFDPKLQTMIAGGNPPDVTSHWGSGGFMEYYNKGMLTDLTPLMKKNNFDPVSIGIPQKELDSYNVNGKQYGIPVYAYVSVLAYNQDLFKKAGLPNPPSSYEDKSWTFDKMVEYAKKLTIVSKDPSKVQYGLNWAWGSNDMNPIYFGAKIYSDDTWTNGGKPSQNFFASPEATNAVQRIADLVWKDKVMPSPAMSQALASGSDVFFTGKVGMEVNGGWVLTGAGSVKFKVGVAAIPVGNDPNVRDVTYVDPLFILKGSKHPDEAFQWIMYLLQKDVQEKSVKLSGGTPPANTNALEAYYNNFPTINKDDLKNVVEGGLKYGTESYNHLITNYTQIRTLVDNEINQVLNGKKKASEVTPGLQQKLNDLFKNNK